MKPFILICLLALSGCAGAQMTPPGMPAIADVQALSAQTRTITPDQIAEFYTNGLTLVQMRCEGYFSQAVMASLQSAQNAGQAQILSGIASGALALAGAGGPMLGGVGLGASALTSMMTNQMSNSLAGEHPAGLFTLTEASQQMLISGMAEPKTAHDAWAALYSIYRECTPAGIQAKKEQAINAAAGHLSVVGAGAPAAQGFAAPSVPVRYHSYPMARVD